MKKILLIGMLIITSLAQNKPVEMQGLSAPQFFIDAINSKSDKQDFTKIDFYIQIPYQNLKFLKIDEEYLAKYSVNLVVSNSEETSVIESKSWEKELRSLDYNITTSPKSYNLESQTLLIKPGIYKAKCVVEDIETKKYFSATFNLNVQKFTDSVSISDIILIEKEDAQKRLIPNISRIISNNNKSLKFYYEIYSPIKDTLEIVYNLKTKDDKEILTKTEKIISEAGKTIVINSIDSLNLTMGAYKLIAFVKKGDYKFSRTKNFVSKIFGFPNSITDLNESIDQLRYIASTSEISFIDEGETYEEKLKRFVDFWRSKDPDPTSEINEVLIEYYRRIEFANKNFKGYSDGWRSDMGMIYITLGQPDNIERHPFESDSRPYEVWYYNNINREFVFVDYNGFGEYRLINNNSRDWSNFRY